MLAERQAAINVSRRGPSHSVHSSVLEDAGMRLMALALLTGGVAACANDVTAPTVRPTPANALAAGNDAGGRWALGRRGMGFGVMFAERRLPDNLKLTESQKSQIKSLLASYRTANGDDLNAMRAVAKQAFSARRSGARMTVEQRRAL